MDKIIAKNEELAKTTNLISFQYFVNLKSWFKI